MFLKLPSAVVISALVIAVGLLVSAPAGAAQYNVCDCIPTPEKPCSCVKTFTIKPWETHIYVGHCSHYDALAPKQTNVSEYVEHWTDENGKVYDQSMVIEDVDSHTKCSPSDDIANEMWQICTNWNKTREDVLTNTVACYKKMFDWRS